MSSAKIYDGTSWIPMGDANVPGIAGEWVPYTTSWTSGATTCNPGTGVGDIQCKYQHIGRIVFYRIDITIGTAPTLGTSTWVFTLPKTRVGQAGGWVYAFSGSADYHGVTRDSTGVTDGIVCTDRESTSYNYINPFTFNANDVLRITGFYETDTEGFTPSAAQVGARVYRTSAKELATATDWTIDWESESFDYGGVWSVSNDTRLTAPEGGIYVISGSVNYDESLQDDPLKLIFKVNGTTEILSQESSNGGTNWSGQSETALWELSAGDYVEMIVKQSSGSNATVNIGEGKTWFSMARTL